MKRNENDQRITKNHEVKRNIDLIFKTKVKINFQLNNFRFTLLDTDKTDLLRFFAMQIGQY